MSDAGAVWRNAGNGYGTGCMVFARRTACIPTARDPDQVYRLRGTTAPSQPLPLPVQRCVVPSVIGKTLGQARQRIRARNCSVGRIRRVRSRNSIRGRVIGETPRPGAVRRRGFPVTLLIGRGRR
jgi:PASTA domain